MLLKNLLLCREPLYGVGQWAAQYNPDLLGLSTRQIGSLNDDRMGRCLDRLFQSGCSSLALAVAAHAVTEFNVYLDELHNDSNDCDFLRMTIFSWLPEFPPEAVVASVMKTALRKFPPSLAD